MVNSMSFQCSKDCFLFVSILWIFLHHLIFPQLFLHPSFFPTTSVFSPIACWCSLITGARRWLLPPAALLCAGCTQILCVCTCSSRWVCAWCCCRSSVGWKKMKNRILLPAIFLVCFYSFCHELGGILKRYV